MYELINHSVHKLSKHALQQVKYIDFLSQSIKFDKRRNLSNSGKKKSQLLNNCGENEICTSSSL